eukprot:Phypoly_transcript_13478.p1 GENE.Phypoly_transcript_13478~~Phypoly_transcript_13478.p1  ORF type:complete len:337 (+),score=46.95 Phypoly_transcript_13478:35-1045(+)
MKLVVLGSLPESQYEGLRLRVSNPSNVEWVDGKDRIKARKVVEDADMVISFGFKLNSSNFDIWDSASKLRVVQFPWVGVDDTDFEYAKKRQITICNSRWNTAIVAEFTLSLLLSAAKLIVSSDATLRKGSWESRGWASKPVRNSNILLLGSGEIPREIVRLLQPFEANITTVRKNPNSGKEPIKGVREISWDQFEEVAAEIDFVICVLPLTPETNGIVDAKKFAAMKKGTIFVNVGRGAVVHEEALYNALKSGHLGGAAIDVWYNYNYALPISENKSNPGNFPFHELPNVVLSPHRACTLADSLSAPNFWSTPLRNWEALQSGLALHEVINYEKGY